MDRTREMGSLWNYLERIPKHSWMSRSVGFRLGEALSYIKLGGPLLIVIIFIFPFQPYIHTVSAYQAEARNGLCA